MVETREEVTEVIDGYKDNTSVEELTEDTPVEFEEPTPVEEATEGETETEEVQYVDTPEKMQENRPVDVTSEDAAAVVSVLQNKSVQSVASLLVDLISKTGLGKQRVIEAIEEAYRIQDMLASGIPVMERLGEIGIGVEYIGDDQYRTVIGIFDASTSKWETSIEITDDIAGLMKTVSDIIDDHHQESKETLDKMFDEATQFMDVVEPMQEETSEDTKDNLA